MRKGSFTSTNKSRSKCIGTNETRVWWGVSKAVILLKGTFTIL